MVVVGRRFVAGWPVGIVRVENLVTAGAIAALFELTRAINTGRTAGAAGPFFDAAQHTLRQLAGALGLTLAEAPAESGADIAARPFIDLLVTVRGDLRTAKQCALADKIRNDLKALGVVIDDTPEGAKWRLDKEA